MAGYLQDGAWLGAAQKANDNCARLLAGLKKNDIQILHSVDANIIFANLPRATHQRLHHGGAIYYLMEGDLDIGNKDELLPARFVCDWSLETSQIDQFISML